VEMPLKKCLQNWNFHEGGVRRFDIQISISRFRYPKFDVQIKITSGARTSGPPG